MFSFGKKSRNPVPPPPQRRIQIVERELGSLTLDEWRQDKALVTQAGNALSSPLIRQMLQVLHNSHPAFQVMIAGDTSERAIQQAKCEGYTMCLSDLEAMGVPTVTTAPIESEFAEEEISKEDMAGAK